jgi:hypothetical protein
MLHTYRLVRLIETHSKDLSTRLVEKVRQSPFTHSYSNVPSDELRQRVLEIYLHLGEWLLGKREEDIGRRYREIGARRFRQQVPLSELIWVLVLTKENIWEYLKDTVLENQEEVFGELEAFELIGQFFDRAIHSSAEGYEHALLAERVQGTAGSRSR